MSVKFIAFEGVDGAGKTTISEKVFKNLIDAGYDVSYINKKGLSGYSPYVFKHLKKIKEVLWDYDANDPLFELGDDHWLFLNLSWFSAVYNCLIFPEMENDKIVIIDNWYYKLFARFSIKPSYSDEYLNEIFNKIPQPDMVIFLDVDPNVSFKRRETFSITETGQMDKQNSYIGYQTKVRERMLEIADKNNWCLFTNNLNNVDSTIDNITSSCVKFLNNPPISNVKG